MLKYTFTSLVLMLLVTLLTATQLDGAGFGSQDYAHDLIKIKLSREAVEMADLPDLPYASNPVFGEQELDKILALTGGIAVIRAHIRPKDRIWEAATGFDRWFLIRLNGKTTVEVAHAAFQQSPLVEFAQPEYLAYLSDMPNDPLNSLNWGHQNTAQLPAWSPPGFSGGSHSGTPVGLVGFDSNIIPAWDQAQGYGSQDIVIAVIDSGVDINHPDLDLVTGYDYGDNDPDPTDTNGHGTAVSGIVAAIADNGIGAAGVAGNTKVMPLKVLNSANALLFTNIANAVIHAADNDADLINLSLGGAGSEGANPSMDAALEYAYSNAGIPIFASTGNNNQSTILYPSNHNKVISVGAATPTGGRKSTITEDGEYWWGSNYGSTVQDSPTAIDIMGPTILPTTDILGAGGYSNSDYYSWFNGTSCASPYVAGVAALLLSRDPSLSPAEVREALVNSATDMMPEGGTGWDRFTGYGLVNANAALNYIADPAQITWAPTSIETTLAAGQTASIPIQIGNAGENLLEFSLSRTPIVETAFSEGFENNGYESQGWSSVINSGNQHWLWGSGGAYGSNPSSAYEGSINARFFNAGSSVVSASLISPPLDLSGVASATLSFYHTQAYRFGQDRLTVAYRNSASGPWTTLAFYTGNIEAWTQRTIELPNLSSEYFLAFSGFCPSSAGWGVTLDAVSISVVSGYEAPWISIAAGTSQIGEISSGNSLNLSVDLDASDLEEGTYTSNLLLSSNSSPNPLVQIPVTLTVGANAALGSPQVSISQSSGVILLQWPVVPNAARYLVYRADQALGDYDLIAETAGLQHQISAGPDMGFFRVTASNP
ncbi:MAG TPA: S8 family serine peptidase [Candidatus Cloacimonadota bacterium]|nr:S8 family serine peptidase [Candidatus Cloacimonadota bacterium]